MLLRYQYLEAGAGHISGNRAPGWSAAHNDQIIIMTQ
jgi:hypothetical protein